jgi:uncharacterized protein
LNGLGLALLWIRGTNFFRIRLKQNFLDMGFDQYHEPANELGDNIRTFARMITSLTEEADAISWYEQRMALEKDEEAKAIMENAQKEEFKHFCMDLEFLFRRKEKWRTIAKNILFKNGDITKNGEKAEEKAD